MTTPSFRDEEGEENALAAEFATATMGFVLLGQGRTDEAREVFRGVLGSFPDDPEALRGMTELGEIPAPREAGEPRALAVEVTATEVDHYTAKVTWTVTSMALRAVGVDPDEPVALCVVTLSAGDGAVRREESFVEGLPREGEHVLSGLRPGATHFVAAGVLTEEGFVPLGRAGAIETAPDASTHR